MGWIWLAVVGGLVGGMELALAQEQPTVEERLIRLEEGQKALMQRIEDVERSLNQRIEDVERSLNQRIEDLRADMNQRFADLNFWLQLIFGTIFATLGAVLVQWATTLRRTDKLAIRLEEHLKETEKDRLLALQQGKLQEIEIRLERLEAGRQMQ